MKRHRLGRRAVIGAAAVAMLLSAAASRLWLLPAHLSGDVNEGWNAAHAALVQAGAQLYPPPGALTGTNYPPLSFLLVAGLGWLSGLDLVIAGRLLALFGCLTTGLCLFRLGRRLAPDAPAAAWWALLGFAGFATTLFRRYLAMDDPQWLAQAAMTAALLVLLPRRPGRSPGVGAVAGAALVMVAAGFIKQSGIAVPLAATLWLAIWHRRRLPVWVAAAGAALAIGLGLGRLVYGADFLPDLLQAQRVYSGSRAVLKSLPVLAAMLPTLWMARPGAGEADSRLWLVILIALIGVPVGCLERGGAGVDVNVHFDAAAAICVLGGIAISRLRGWPRQRVLACLWLPLLVAWGFAVTASWHELAHAGRARQAWRQSIARVAAIQGDVACQTPTLCYWAGKGFALDGFLYGQHMRVTGDRHALDIALAEHRFAAVQLDEMDDPDDPLRAALQAAYPHAEAIGLGMLQSR